VGVGVTVNGSVGGQIGVDVLPLREMNMSSVDFGVAADASLSGSASAVVGVDDKRLDHQLVPNFTLARRSISAAIAPDR
jgi:hypothetical protein